MRSSQTHPRIDWDIIIPSRGDCIHIHNIYIIPAKAGIQREVEQTPDWIPDSLHKNEALGNDSIVLRTIIQVAISGCKPSPRSIELHPEIATP